MASDEFDWQTCLRLHTGFSTVPGYLVWCVKEYRIKAKDVVVLVLKSGLAP